jgi:hypothetical protein
MPDGFTPSAQMKFSPGTGGAKLCRTQVRLPIDQLHEYLAEKLAY